MKKNKKDKEQKDESELKPSSPIDINNYLINKISSDTGMNNDLKDLLLTFLKQKYQEEPFSLILHTDTSEFPIPLIMTAEAIKCRLLDRYMMEEIPFRQFMALNTRIVLDFLKEPKYENIINEIYQKRHGEHLKYEDMLDSVEQYIGDLFDAIRRSSSRGKLLNKLLDLLRVHSAIMATQQIGIITDKFRNDQNDNSIWKNMYYLGQYISNALHTGVLAHLYHSKIASEIKTQSLMHLDELKAEARTLAEEYLIDGEYETFDELAGDIFEDQKKKHPELRSDINYFYEIDFVPPLSLSDLCRHIKNNIGEDIHLKSKEISIDWLNELLKVPYLYNAIIKNVIRLQDLPRDIKKMYVETAAIREKKRYSQLTRKEQNVIIPLNRLLLENAYPSMTPKRPKDYSKRYTLNTVKNALKDIAEERGLKI